LDTDTTKQWRLPADEGNFRVWVAQGIECDTLCDVPTGIFSCQEVVELPAACLQNSISTPPPQLPFYSLGEPAAFPSNILRDILKSAAPNTTFNETNQNGSSYFYDGGRLAAFYDNTTGQTSFWPKLESLNPASNISIPFESFSKYLNDPQIFPSDDTVFTATEGSILFGSANSTGTISSPAPYLIDLRIERNVSLSSGDHPIYGPGTKGFFSYGSDGNIQSLTHRWRPATNSKTTLESISDEQVTQNILDQLSASNLGNAIIDTVHFCFYDSGEQYIQPAYRYHATVSGPDGATNISLAGYISAVSEPPEALPSLNPPATQAPPTTPSTNKTNSIPRLKKRQLEVTVGRYPIYNSNISPESETETNAFWAGLAGDELIDTFIGKEFINEQYHWGDDSEYESDKNYYVDSVNLAYTVGHGNIHQFWPNGNEGPVQIADIGSGGGYGSGAGGSLCYWLLKGCDAIPTITQYINKYGASYAHEAWDVWWDVFNGIHVITGFSTEYLVEDGIGQPLAAAIGLGAGVAAAWMNAVNQASDYNPLQSYLDPNWGTTYYGRPIAVFPCGHADDTVFLLDDLGAPDCLGMFWY